MVEENMRIFPTLILAAGIGLAAPAASAMAMNGLAPAVATSEEMAQSVENVRWICGPYGGCRWVPGWRHWGPRPWRPYGYYGGWRREGYGWGGYHHHRHYW
jgi:hypothetical protein